MIPKNVFKNYLIPNSMEERWKMLDLGVKMNLIKKMMVKKY